MSDEQKKKFEKLRNNIPGLHIRNDGWCDEAMKAAYNLALEDAADGVEVNYTGHEEDVVIDMRKSILKLKIQS